MCFTHILLAFHCVQYDFLTFFMDVTDSKYQTNKMNNNEKILFNTGTTYYSL